MDRLRLKNDAKMDIQNRIWEAFQPFAIILVITWFIDIFSTVANRASNEKVSIAFAVIASILSFVWFFLRFPIQVGIMRYYLRFIERERQSVNNIFDDLKQSKVYWEEFKAFLLTRLLIVLGLIFFIVPGIYLALIYSQIEFVFAEHPEYKTSQAIERSKDLMRGHTLELFMLYLSFFFWYILEVITFGFAGIYVAPYTTASYTRYYKSLCYLLDGDDYSFKSGANGGYYGKNNNPFNGGNGENNNKNFYGADNGTAKRGNKNGDSFVNSDGGIVSGVSDDKEPFDEMK